MNMRKLFGGLVGLSCLVGSVVGESQAATYEASVLLDLVDRIPVTTEREITPTDPIITNITIHNPNATSSVFVDIGFRTLLWPNLLTFTDRFGIAHTAASLGQTEGGPPPDFVEVHELKSGILDPNNDTTFEFDARPL